MLRSGVKGTNRECAMHCGQDDAIGDGRHKKGWHRRWRAQEGGTLRSCPKRGGAPWLKGDGCVDDGGTKTISSVEEMSSNWRVVVEQHRRLRRLLGFSRTIKLENKKENEALSRNNTKTTQSPRPNPKRGGDTNIRQALLF
ncbi:hypothetical protein U1Q18_019777 [Sarracenia purpurea var. burkii]